MPDKNKVEESMMTLRLCFCVINCLYDTQDD